MNAPNNDKSFIVIFLSRATFLYIIHMNLKKKIRKCDKNDSFHHIKSIFFIELKIILYLKKSLTHLNK